MREIKFKAFFRGEMLYNAFIWNGVLYWDDANSKGHHSLVYTPDPIPWLQYTGMKDKNGVEIYEGDILAEMQNANQISMAVVYWGYEQSGWMQKCTNNSYDCSLEPDIGGDESIFYDSIIIGNIYENPELIK